MTKNSVFTILDYTTGATQPRNVRKVNRMILPQFIKPSNIRTFMSGHIE